MDQFECYKERVKKFWEEFFRKKKRDLRIFLKIQSWYLVKYFSKLEKQLVSSAFSVPIWLQIDGFFRKYSDFFLIDASWLLIVMTIIFCDVGPNIIIMIRYFLRYPKYFHHIWNHENHYKYLQHMFIFGWFSRNKPPAECTMNLRSLDRIFVYINELFRKSFVR